MPDDARDPASNPTAAHRPVLGREAVEAVVGSPDGVYVDGTFGRGGHSALLLAALGPQARLVALDRDPQAVASASTDPRFASDRRFAIVHSRFSKLDAVLDAHGIGSIDGLLLDLGVSSPQFDDPARGFTFSGDGPLDMRMDPTEGRSVRDWLLSASEQDIAEVLKNYGDERFAVPIAKAIVARRRQKRSTMGKNPATRTYQALRIHTNSEIAELSRILTLALGRLAIGGRLAVISFHSLEDRMVKQFIAQHAGRAAERDPITGAAIAPVLLESLGKTMATAAEIEANPRARSAVLRVARKRADPPGATGAG